MENPSTGKKIAKLISRVYYSFAAVILFLTVWELAARFEIGLNPLFMPPMTKIFGTLIKFAITGELWKHLFTSLRRSLIGYCCGISFAIPLGLAIGWFKRFGNFLNPLLNTFRNIPTLALLPVFVMLFGITETAKVAVIFWGVLWSVLLNTIAGVRDVDSQLIRAARSMGTSSLRLFVTVVLPGSLPHIFTGMRISATTSILILIAAEMLGASKGLGYAVYFYQANMKFAEMYSYIVVLALLGIALNVLLNYIEKRSFLWRDESG
ncbi:MAG: ABC transporter permease, partial [Peptococcaceae bacterium]|nr:ABC transporter permease [Peptococcaceae bacterium]